MLRGKVEQVRQQRALCGVSVVNLEAMRDPTARVRRGTVPSAHAADRRQLQVRRTGCRRAAWRTACRECPAGAHRETPPPREARTTRRAPGCEHVPSRPW